MTLFRHQQHHVSQFSLSLSLFLSTFPHQCRFSFLYLFIFSNTIYYRHTMWHTTKDNHNDDNQYEGLAMMTQETLQMSLGHISMFFYHVFFFHILTIYLQQQRQLIYNNNHNNEGTPQEIDDGERNWGNWAQMVCHASFGLRYFFFFLYYFFNVTYKYIIGLQQHDSMYQLGIGLMMDNWAQVWFFFFLFLCLYYRSTTTPHNNRGS